MLPKQVIFLLLSFLIWPTLSVADNPLKDCKDYVRYGIPSKNPVLLCRKGYALSHDSDCKIPIWVAYVITKDQEIGKVDRTDDFRKDPDLKPGERAELSDYKGKGYDRGHMAPAQDMSWDEDAMSESFLLSNMAPQVGIGFNRHIWQVLERHVRVWTKKRGELYVVTGPIFATNEVKRIGNNRVCVPSHFYKVIYDPRRVEVIAFILPNQKLRTKDLPKYIKSVDEVEDYTDLDFLSKLKPKIEKRIESRVQPALW